MEITLMLKDGKFESLGVIEKANPHNSIDMDFFHSWGPDEASGEIEVYRQHGYDFQTFPVEKMIKLHKFEMVALYAREVTSDKPLQIVGPPGPITIHSVFGPRMDLLKNALDELDGKK